MKIITGDRFLELMVEMICIQNGCICVEICNGKIVQAPKPHQEYPIVHIPPITKHGYAIDVFLKPSEGIIYAAGELYTLIGKLDKQLPNYPMQNTKIINTTGNTQIETNYKNHIGKNKKKSDYEHCTINVSKKSRHFSWKVFHISELLFPQIKDNHVTHATILYDTEEITRFPNGHITWEPLNETNFKIADKFILHNYYNGMIMNHWIDHILVVDKNNIYKMFIDNADYVEDFFKLPKITLNENHFHCEFCKSRIYPYGALYRNVKDPKSSVLLYDELYLCYKCYERYDTTSDEKFRFYNAALEKNNNFYENKFGQLVKTSMPGVYESNNGKLVIASHYDIMCFLNDPAFTKFQNYAEVHSGLNILFIEQQPEPQI